MNKIKEYRRKLGLTQIELARACNVSQGALSGYETGRLLCTKITYVSITAVVVVRRITTTTAVKYITIRST